jgi:hypothetical protein
MPTPDAIRKAGAHLAAPYHVTGELVLDGSMLHGWCWSPARPKQRLRVALLRDDDLIATAVASRLRLDIVRDGQCDGYHGFSFQVPPAPYARLEVREVATKQVFGRVLGETLAEPESWVARCDALGAQLASGHAALGGPVTRLPPSAGDVAVRGLRLPVLNAPATSIVLDVASPAEAAPCVASLAPLLRHYAAEVILLCDARAPEDAAVASVSGLKICRHPAMGFAARMNFAIQQARGARLLLSFATELGVGDLRCWLDQSPGQGEIMASASVLEASGLLKGSSAGAARSGPLLAASREVFSALPLIEGFDHAGGHLSVLDFVLRAQEAGLAVLGVGQATPMPIAPGDAARRLAQSVQALL